MIKVKINSQVSELNSLSELEPLKSLVANDKPKVTKRQPKQTFVFAYQIEDGKCKYLTIQEGHQKKRLPENCQRYEQSATSQSSALSLFKKQVRREAGVNNFSLLSN